MLVVREELDGEEREPTRLEQPAQLARRDVELDQPVRDVRVVVEEAEAARPPVADRAVEAAVVRGERAEQELTEPPRRVEPVGALEPVAGLGERGEREAVPRGERLVVAERLRARVALGEHALPELRLELAAHDVAAVLERLEHAPAGARPPSASSGVHV